MRSLTTLTVGVSLALSAGIHASIVNVHLREWLVAGIFFVAAAIGQAWCAYAVLRNSRLRVAGLGAMVSLVLLATWALSRSFGLPLGPGASEREAIAVLDAVATAAELITVGTVLAALRATSPADVRARRSSRTLAVAVVASTFGLGIAAAAALPHTHRLNGGHVDVAHRGVIRGATTTDPSRAHEASKTESVSGHAHEGQHVHADRNR